MITRTQYFEQAIAAIKDAPIRSPFHQVETHITLMRLESELKREMYLEETNRPKVLLNVWERHDSIMSDK